MPHFFRRILRYFYELVFFPRSLYQLREQVKHLDKLQAKTCEILEQDYAVKPEQCSTDAHSTLPSSLEQLSLELADIKSTLYTIQQIQEKMGRMQILQNLDPELIKLFTPTFSVTDNIMQDLRGWYRHEYKNMSLVDWHIEETTNLIWRAHSMPPEQGIAIFDECMQLRGFDQHYILAGFIAYVNYMTCDVALLLKLGETFAAIKHSWGPGFEGTWNIYMQTLLAAGETQKAHAILDRYRNTYGENKLENHPTVACFAKEAGCKSEVIMHASEAHGWLIENEHKDPFAQLVAGQRTAVVGNGPYVIGKGCGESIDAHDLVVRFNAFASAGAYSKDFGNKTDIWMVHIGDPWLDENPLSVAPEVIAKIKRIVLINPYQFGELSFASLKRLYRLYALNPNISYYPMEMLIACRKAMKYSYPTAGAKMLFWLKQVGASLEATSVYSFSFQEECTFSHSRFPHYYDKTECHHIHHSHDLHRENAFLRNLLYN